MKHLYTRLLTILILAFVAQGAVAKGQKMNLEGSIKDSDTGESIPFATIVVKDSSVGTTSNADGKYSIRAKQGDILLVDCLGYQTRNVVVGRSNTLNIKLRQSSVEIDEVVAIGYGSMRKSDLTGASSRITDSTFAQQSSPTEVASMLEGRMAGVDVSAGEGGPNAAFSVQIRGASSVGASSEPLYVIDGFPIESASLSSPSDGFQGGETSPLANIDPSNIESIEVFKDASSTAIYGSRGANGVVMITTKSGKSGKGVVNYSGQLSFSNVSNYVDLLDSEGFAEYMWHRSFHGSVDPYIAEQEAVDAGDTRQYYNYKQYADSTNTNWQREIYRVAVSQSHNVSLSGGNERVRYNMGVGYLNNEGVILNNDFTRYSFNGKVNADVKEWLTADFNTSFGYTNSSGVATGVGGNITSIGIVSQALRKSPLVDLSSDIDWDIVDGDDGDEVAEASSPLTFLNDVTNQTNATRLIANLALTAQLLPGLTLKNSIGTNIIAQNFESFYPSTTSKGSRSNGLANRAYQDSKSWVYEGVFNYNKSFTPSRRLSATAAFTAEENYKSRFSVSSSNFLYQELGVDNMGMGTELSAPSTSKSQSALASVLARVNYTHNNKYLFTLSGRADGSSRFAAGNKWAMFPSAAFAWRASQEDFIKNIKQISNLKFRASYGITGNQAIDNYSTLAVLNSNNYSFDDVLISGLSLSRIQNSDLRWESTRQYDLGVDLGLFNGRLNLIVDYYNKYTYDMLMDVSVPASTGYNKYIMNYGSMVNRGWEFSLDARIIEKRNFQWTMNYNMSFNRNEVLSIGGADYIDYGYSRVIVGKPIGQFWGYKQVGIIESQEQLDLYTDVGAFGSQMNIGQRRFADVDSSSSIYDKDGKLQKAVIDSDDMTIIGSYEPKFIGGMSQSLNYKGLSLDMQFKFRWGGQIYNATAADMIIYEKKYNNRLTAALDYWDAEANSNSVNPHPSSDDLSKYINVFVEDASFLKLSAVTLGYNINKRKLHRYNITACKIYLRGNNLLTLTSYTGTDPEADMGSSMSPGYDRGGQPFTSSISAGIKLTF